MAFALITPQFVGTIPIKYAESKWEFETQPILDDTGTAVDFTTWYDLEIRIGYMPMNSASFVTIYYDNGFLGNAVAGSIHLVIDAQNKITGNPPAGNYVGFIQGKPTVGDNYQTVARCVGAITAS